MTIFLQLIISAVIVSLSFLLAVVGIQTYHLLHEFRLTLKKFNHILDNTQTISETIARPITSVNNFFTEVKDLVNNTQDEIINETPDRTIPAVRADSPKSFRRFFKRAGLPLRS
jgi:hypothetical protein